MSAPFETPRRCRRAALDAAGVTVLTRQLADLLDAGIPLLPCLGVLVDSESPPGAAAVVATLRRDVAAGRPLSDALRRFPRFFDTAYLRLVVLGEASSQMSAMLLRIAAARERRAHYRQQLQQALIYPAFVCVVAISVVVALMVWAVPAFRALFDSFDAPLPALTQAVLSLSDRLAAIGPAALALGAVAAAIIAGAARRSRRLRLALSAHWLATPLLGTIALHTALARWASGLATLLGAGMPLVDALAASAHGTGQLRIDDASAHLAACLRRGERLAHAMRQLSRRPGRRMSPRDRLFPAAVIAIVDIGEQTGALERMLADLGERLARDTQQQAVQLMRLLEPLIIVICGAWVALLVLSLYLPIIELGNVV